MNWVCQTMRLTTLSNTHVHMRIDCVKYTIVHISMVWCCEMCLLYNLLVNQWFHSVIYSCLIMSYYVFYALLCLLMSSYALIVP